MELLFIQKINLMLLNIGQTFDLNTEKKIPEDNFIVHTEKDRENYIKSIEALASDDDLPNYVFEGPGEILSVKDEYAQVRWRRPVPDVWLKLDQLKEYI